MNRRTFLQSVIALPLAAVGMPRVCSTEQRIDLAMRGARPIGDAELLAMLPRRFRVVGGGAFGEFERGLSPDATREWADALARQIDKEALRHALEQGLPFSAIVVGNDTRISLRSIRSWDEATDRRLKPRGKFSVTGRFLPNG